jgi:hypothetical protein
MTPHACDKELPCGQHITVILWIFGLLLTVLSGVVYGTIDNRNKAVEEHKTMIQQRMESDNRIWDQVNENQIEIVQRLASIEAKITK